MSKSRRHGRVVAQICRSVLLTPSLSEGQCSRVVGFRQLVAASLVLATTATACHSDEAAREDCSQSGASCSTTPLTAAPPTGNIDGSTFALTVRPPVVPAGTASVALLLTARTDTDEVIGLDATLDSWDGDLWTTARLIQLCVGDGCTVIERPADAAIPDLGIRATPGNPTSIGLLSVKDLRPGWYRVATRGAADGLFEVTDA